MFRELKRKNKQLTEEECLTLLKNERRGVLSVNGEDGYPYAMPMNHFYDERDGAIYFHSGKVGYRTDALRLSDKACFCVLNAGEREEGDWALTVKSVIVFGRVETLTDPCLIADVCARLSRKFTSDEDYIQSEIDQYAKATLLLRLTPEHMTGKRVKES